MRTRPALSQTWATFLRTHAADICVCDFLQVVDVFFRPLYRFFIIELETRRVVHVGVTRDATQVWVAQQWREATRDRIKGSLSESDVAQKRMSQLRRHGAR
jgi:hypothetical protein